MADATIRQLQADLATVRAEVAALRRHRSRRLLPALLAAFLVTILPLATLAAGPFTDLTPGSPHNADIAAIADAGITKGCDPPDFASYCPNGLVTRQEMASFLARTAGLGGNPPVANAATVGGYAPSALVRASRAGGEGTTAGSQRAIVLTLTIEAPAAGVVLVNAGATGRPSNTGNVPNPQCPCEGYLYVVHAEKLALSPYPAYVSMASFALGGDANSAGVSYAFPVDAGTNTFTLYGTRVAGNVNIAFAGQGTALYVPFGGSGGVGALGQP